ncbi:MAG: DUF6169 family protein [Bacteroides sp.]|nr:DUF6169 family protein [Bacteroides sp.]MCM1403034.1 DUF6169 family protein [Bacteroides sp.]MCM1442829.1 DUF6169 family protein [Muribaculum sp.]MCM1576192.1 DUF6169 family protein [Bacteroides sp.]
MKEASNSLHPYDYKREDNFRYTFTTDNGIPYVMYFVDCSDSLNNCGKLYSFNIERAINNCPPQPIDSRIAHTVVSILLTFFSNEINAMIMVCDTSDNKHTKRKQLFERWYNIFNNGVIEKKDYTIIANNTQHYISLFYNISNPLRHQLIHELCNIIPQLSK